MGLESFEVVRRCPHDVESICCGMTMSAAVDLRVELFLGAQETLTPHP